MFKTGQSGNPNGRPKGQKNKITRTVREWISDVIDDNRDQYIKDLKSLSPIDRIKAINSLLPYAAVRMTEDDFIKPLKNTDHGIDIEKWIELQFNN